MAKSGPLIIPMKVFGDCIILSDISAHARRLIAVGLVFTFQNYVALLLVHILVQCHADVSRLIPHGKLADKQ